MYCVLKIAKNLQTALDEGELFERDFISDMELYLQEEIKEFSGGFYETVQVLRKDLLRLEVLREEWKANLKATENLFQKGEIWYMDKRERYKAEIKNTIGQEQWDIYKEQLLMFFLYTYFCLLYTSRCV